MIVEWLMQLALAAGTWVTGQLPDVSEASNLVVTASNAFSPILAGAGALGAWLPWDTLGVVLPIVMTFYLLFFGIKFLRQLWSYVPQFGGSG